ncbi:alpha/beta hydrolase [Spongiibacter sp. KMU-158]|uniref:Alpha/beta hydrolase n=1 Tax=Spongiibacter pelagi TaxID=2760804 RepID=A0A927C4A7_9GAMM|nr:alpha/beta hydrolase [Spongiibacter pelagi]MBD2859180.1 alpha/beta hydrolase [Spongiibacter pelagi]
MVEEYSLIHDGLRLAGRLWGKGNGPKIIALHGWFDNAASFDALAEKLTKKVPDCQILALDLPGHGHSDHKPASGNYAIWDDLRSVVGVADALAWSSFYLLGHSRGAMMAAMLAGALPERVLGVVCLDGLLAEPTPQEQLLPQLGEYLRDFSREQRPPRAFSSLEEAADARIRVMSMKPESALKIVARGTTQNADGSYSWSSDRRLSLASPVKLSMEQWRLVAKPSVPAMFISAKQGLGPEILKLLPELSAHFAVHELEGDHHFHMDVAVEGIAELVGEFVKN